MSLKFIRYDITSRLLLKWEKIVSQCHRDHLQEKPKKNVPVLLIKIASPERFHVPADFSHPNNAVRATFQNGGLKKGYRLHM